MKITGIRVYQVDLPLHEGNYSWSEGKSVDVFDSTVVIVDTDAGISGVGEGVTVTLAGPTSRITETDSAGNYRFGFVPLGVYSVEAADGDGNRGRTAATVTRTSEVVDADIGYLGRGRVSGTVETALGFPVPDVEVTVTSNSIFGGRFTVTSGAVGEFAVDGVFVGNFTVSVVDPVSGLGGFTSGRPCTRGMRPAPPEKSTSERSSLASASSTP